MPLEAGVAPSPPPGRTERGALTVLRELLAGTSTEDVEFLLEMARRLAGRS